MKIFVSSGIGVSGIVVRTYTWSWAAHAGFLLDSGQILDSTPSRGVQIRAVNTLMDKKIKYFDVAGIDKVKDNLLIWLNQQIGKKYDWSAIFGLAVHRDWRDPEDWYCSELVAAGCEVAGFPLLRTTHLNRVTPCDLLLSPYLIG